ncbi:MAG: energy-coupling factor transporter ATPase [Clostridia bacterium]
MSVKFEKVTYIYDNGTSNSFRALKEISLSIKTGEFFAIIGHSGSGKSTLIQLINGLLKPTMGKVFVNGLDTSAKDLKALRKTVGMVFQYPEHQLFDETVYDDIAFGVRKMGLHEVDVKERVYATIKLLGIPESLLTHSPFEISGGQKRRVAMAGVIVMNPDILVLDEPAAGLDPSGKKEMFKLIQKLNKQMGLTIVMVSHNMEDVALVADRIAVLVEGEIILSGAPAEVYSDQERLRKIHLDVPEITSFMNLVMERTGQPNHTFLSVAEAKQAIVDRLKPPASESESGGEMP